MQLKAARPRAFPLSVAVAVALVSASRSGRAVEGGAVDRETTHAVAIARGAPSASAVRCSGTLVSRNVVLTVRHCIAAVIDAERACDVRLGDVTGESARDHWVNVGHDAHASSEWKRVSAIKVPEPNAICGDDLALLILESPIAESTALAARPLLDEAAFARAIDDRRIGLAAFGATAPGGGPSGVRHGRTDFEVKCVPGRPGFRCGTELQSMAASEFAVSRGVCSGDSGGGATSASDRNIVLGVLSRGDQGLDDSLCASGVFVRTDRWAWLIAKTVLDAASASLAAPSWASEKFPAQPAVGDFCQGEASCGQSAACTSFDGRRSWTCASKCQSSASCGAGRQCEDGVCAPAPPSVRRETGCAISSMTPSLTRYASVELSAMALLFALRLRKSARRRRASRSR